MSSTGAPRNADAAAGSPQELFTAEDSRAVLAALATVSNQANSLPSGDSRNVALLTNSTVSDKWRQAGVHVEMLMDKIFGTASDECSVSDGENEGAVKTKYSDMLEESLERAHTALDAAEGSRDTPLTDAEARADARALSVPSKASSKSTMGSLPVDYKPQRKFYDFPIDNSDAPFVPPFSNDAKKSIPIFVESSTPSLSDDSKDSESKKKRTKSKRKRDSRPHPYELEIAESIAANISRTFDPDNVTVFRSNDDTPFTFVDTERGLINMAERLAKCNEIAVDLEAHQLRSFLGFTCLVQISSRKEDFVIDVMKLRAHVHRALAPIFTDPSIVKVMHGAGNDIVWLERDFGIYVVGLFDTALASKALDFQLISLSYLLLKFCGVLSVGKKKFQRADWRRRPLPEDMLAYARSDTHYLLYIFDRLRVELNKLDKFANVWRKSGEVSRQRFRKPIFKPNQMASLCAKLGPGFDVNQIRVLNALDKWRNATARKEDESCAYVAPDSILFEIARARDRARTSNGVLRAVTNKKAYIVRNKCAEIARIVSNTLDEEIDEERAAEIKQKLEDAKKRRNKLTKKAKASAGAEENTESGSSSDLVTSDESVPTLTKPTVIKKKLEWKPSTAVPKVQVSQKKTSQLFGDDSSSETSASVESNAPNAND